MRVIEIVEVLLARIASAPNHLGEPLVDLFLERLVLGDGLDDDVAIGEDLGRGRGADRRQHVRQVLGRGPADLDPAHDDVLGAVQAVGEPGVVDVDHRRGNSRPGVRRDDARAHQPGARDADALHRPAASTAGSLTPGSRDSRFFMKKMAIRLAMIGEPCSS